MFVRAVCVCVCYISLSLPLCLMAMLSNDFCHIWPPFMPGDTDFPSLAKATSWEEMSSWPTHIHSPSPGARHGGPPLGSPRHSPSRSCCTFIFAVLTSVPCRPVVRFSRSRRAESWRGRAARPFEGDTRPQPAKRALLPKKSWGLPAGDCSGSPSWRLFSALLSSLHIRSPPEKRPRVTRPASSEEGAIRVCPTSSRRGGLR